ncbi:MAG: DUF4367 domain-containing protein [Oscillospiraceae bacterium]|nr:DUF4367 domain-containing protein [Oscillospiraceae bacterium]
MELNNKEEWLFDQEKLEEIHEDISWRVAMNKNAQAEGEELLKLNEEIKDDPRYKMPAEADKRIFASINKYFRRKNANNFAKNAKKALSRVSVAFFVFAAAVTIAYTSVEAFRVQVLNFLINFNPEYTSLKLGNESNGNMIAGFGNTYAPSYVPDNYRFNSILNMGNFKTIEYVNDEENLISFYELNQANVTNIDTENADVVKSIKINGAEGLYVLKNGMATVSWAHENMIFMIIAQLSEEEIVHIAKSVIFIK